MEPSVLKDIEQRFAGLAFDEQLLVIESLIQHLRKIAAEEEAAWDTDLAAMAADPGIQRELRHIDAEFRCTEPAGKDVTVAKQPDSRRADPAWRRL